MEGALGSPFRSYEGSLFCDTAVVANVPHDGRVAPYTLAQTMDAGWCWKIPVEEEDHRGYVHSSKFVDEEQAIAEMRAKNPRMGEPSIVRFRSGRHEHFWKGNTVAIGNAYGFVEPLESTALHMVIVEIAYLLGGLEGAAEAPPDRAFANARVGEHWDYIRWFLALHYRFNRKLDTPFWRACRAEVDVSGFDRALAVFREKGPWMESDGVHYGAGDPAFGYAGVMIMLLGQKVPGPPPRPSVSRETWARRLAAQRKLVSRALPQAEALALLRRRPDLLEEVVRSPESWCASGVELIEVRPDGAAPIAPKPTPRPTAAGPYDDLILYLDPEDPHRPHGR
jgi:tryptophan halogenase